MESNVITVFMGGDVYSESGICAVEKKLKPFIKKHQIDFVILNAENASGGYGLLEYDAKRLFDAGADVLTGGNHIFEKREAFPFLNEESRVLRPANYPELGGVDFAELPEIPGRGFGFYEKNGITFAVLNLQGREFMTALDCPFKTSSRFVQEAQQKDAVLLVDFHAESNQEKEALGFFLDGKASAVCGTHTHVQTADEKILPQGTAYITDLGMTGPLESVIGASADIAIKRNLTQILYKLEDAQSEPMLQGVIIKIDAGTKKAASLERVSC